MKKILCSLAASLLLFSCFKEDAKKPYDLYFQFDNGISLHLDILIIERDINNAFRKNETDEIFKGKKIDIEQNQLYFFRGYNTMDLQPRIFVTLLKTKERKIMGIMNYGLVYTNTTALTGADNSRLYGNLELEGKYKSLFKKITVENGTFNFYWSNAEDFGLEDQVLKGKWTLKRL